MLTKTPSLMKKRAHRKEVREPRKHPQHTPILFPDVELTKSIAPVIKPTRQWPEAFKLSAVRLSRRLEAKGLGGTKKTAAVFGVRETLVSCWRNEYKLED